MLVFISEHICFNNPWLSSYSLSNNVLVKFKKIRENTYLSLLTEFLIA